MTNTADRPIAELELRHRRRARAEDRIRAARATGLRNLPVWLEIVQIALDLLAWMPMLALTGKARPGKESVQGPPDLRHGERDEG